MNEWMNKWINEWIKLFLCVSEGPKARQVPDSCCRSGDKAICTGQTYFAGPPNHINAHDEKRRKKNPYLYTDVRFHSMKGLFGIEGKCSFI